MEDVVVRARRLSAELLAPAAATTAAAEAVPRAHLDALADAGLYGLTGPADAGGLAADAVTVAAVVEELAAGDLATTFVWLQHLGVVGQLAAAGPAQLRTTFLADLCTGRRRAGVALQAALRPGPPAVRLSRDGDDLVLDGAVPWVTGWGLVDAHDGPTLTTTPQPLVAVRASATAELRLTGHRVPASRLVLTAPLTALLARDAAGLRLNGSLALGLALRCTRLLGPSALDPELAAARSMLDEAGPADLPVARATAAAFAHRAAGALAVATGSTALVAGSDAERATVEALFLLVFGSRPAIKEALLSRLGAAGPPP